MNHDGNSTLSPAIGTLSGHLREVVNVLRGPVDAADFKTYIFPLAVFQAAFRCVHDEEYAAPLAESGDDAEYAVLFRMFTEGDIRRELLEMDILDAGIGQGRLSA